MSYPALRCKQGQLTVAQVNAGYPIVPARIGRVLTVVDGWVRSVGAADTVTAVDVVDSYLHNMADATTLAGTVPATEQDPTGYALAIELMADHNTHTAAVAYHRQATAAVASTASTSTATWIAQVNVARLAMLAHYADAGTHGGIGDATRYALVAATSPCTSAGTALTLINLLATYHLAHITVTTALSKVWGSFAVLGLADAAVLRLGDSNTTATNLLSAGTTGRGIWVVKSGSDIGTATALDYSISYVAT